MINDLPLFAYQQGLKPKKPQNKGPFAPKNKQRVNEMLRLIQQGHSVDHSCIQVGLNRSTIYRWRKCHLDFAAQMDRAQSSSISISKPCIDPNSIAPMVRQYADSLAQLLRQGSTITAATQELGLSRYNVYKLMKNSQDFRYKIKDAHRYDRSGSPKPTHSHKPMGQVLKKYEPSLAQSMAKAISLLREGHTLRAACQSASIGGTTLYKHMRNDADLKQAVEAARELGTRPPMQPNLEWGLYFIRAQGSSLVKVGISQNPTKRLKRLQTGSPLILYLDTFLWGVAHHEKEIHRILKSKGLHSHGEWFQSEAQAIAMEIIQKLAQSEVSSFEELVG
jgi:DNA invertase Pin-like site-specific DNA recombinase